MEQITILKILSTTIKLLLLIILSWFLVHIFALLGIFIAIGFFIWWLFYPRYAVCFSCRVKRVGEYCKVCGSTVTDALARYPKNIKSALINVVFLLLASLLSIFAVIVEYKVLQSVMHPVSPKTVSFVIPSESQYRVGEIFPLKIQLTGIEVPINAIQADVGFDKNRLEVVDISTKDSFATVFLQKEMNNELVYARLSGGLPNPGFNAPTGLFGTVYFKAKQAGLAQISFLDTSLVLANDGDGTNVIKEFTVVSYLITPETLPIDDQEMQNTLILQNVLGIEEEQNENQILLFEEDDNVLGVEDSELEEMLDDDVEKKGIFDTILEILTKIDLFIMDRLDWFLSIFNLSLPAIDDK